MRGRTLADLKLAALQVVRSYCHRICYISIIMAELATVAAEVTEAKPCSNPGCEQPGTKSCSACKTTTYCSAICQTADWPHHKEECDGHLRKVGKANLSKASGFHGSNWAQTLRYGEIAATKLKKLKDRRLETVQDISEALGCKYDALSLMERYKEAKECAEERYTLWAMNHMRHPGSMEAALALIQSCLHNDEFEDAEHYARHAMFMINDMTDNFIPSDQRSKFLADASYWLARATYELAKAGGIPPEEKQKAGEEAIALARQALEIHTRLFGIEDPAVASDMNALANALGYFHDVDDDEVLRLMEQAIAIIRRIEGNSSINVAASLDGLGIAYNKRARRAHAAMDIDRCIANLELALPHFVEASRIFRVNNHVHSADETLQTIAGIEENMRLIGMARAVAARLGFDSMLRNSRGSNTYWSSFMW